MSEAAYGTRKCLQCGAEFEPLYCSQVTCSVKCAVARRNAQRRRADVKYRARRKKYLLELLAELDTAYAEIDWLNCPHEAALTPVRESRASRHAATETQATRNEKAKPQKTALPEPVEKIAAKAGLPPLLECKRLKLKAVLLPCGEHEICYKPTRCARIGGAPEGITLEPGERFCKQCGQPFMFKNPAQRYCSKKCQEDAAKAKIYQLKK